MDHAAWKDKPGEPNPTPMLRKVFHLDGTVRAARLYITSLSLYEAELNGRRVGDAELTPGWTSYGSTAIIGTDPSWKASIGPILPSNIPRKFWSRRPHLRSGRSRK